MHPRIRAERQAHAHLRLEKAMRRLAHHFGEDYDVEGRIHPLERRDPKIRAIREDEVHAELLEAWLDTAEAHRETERAVKKDTGGHGGTK